MSRLLRVSLALGAVFFVAILSACGSDVPSGQVAKVDNLTISEKAFDRWLTISALSGGGGAVPDAPEFTKCIATAKAAAAKPAKGQAKPTDAQYKQQCQSRYDQLLQQTATFLIRSTWLDKEADRQGVKVTKEQVAKEFEKARLAAFPKAADFKAFLKSTGSQLADLEFRQRTQLLQQKITEKITKDVKAPTEADLKAYYEKNKSQFGQPEARTLQVVVNSDKAKAAAAKKAIESGQSWSSVVKQYSDDPTTKSTGGTLRNVQKGQGEKAFDEAAFSAKKGTLVGPVKTTNGYYVFRVVNIRPEKYTKLDDVKAQLKSQLASENQQKVLTKFGQEYQKRWRAKTVCVKKATVQDCKNWKAPKTTSTAATTTPAATTTTPTTTTSK